MYIPTLNTNSTFCLFIFYFFLAWLSSTKYRKVGRGEQQRCMGQRTLLSPTTISETGALLLGREGSNRWGQWYWILVVSSGFSGNILEFIQNVRVLCLMIIWVNCFSSEVKKGWRRRISNKLHMQVYKHFKVYHPLFSMRHIPSYRDFYSVVKLTFIFSETS